jgi:hypothetical protein
VLIPGYCSAGARASASIERVARVFTSAVPEEVRVGGGVVRVARVGRDGFLVGVLSSGEVVPRLPQECGIPAQRLRVRRLCAHRPLEVVLRPEMR